MQRDRHQIQAGAVRAVSRYAGGTPRFQRFGSRHSARGRRAAADKRQDSRTQRAHGRGRNEIQL